MGIEEVTQLITNVGFPIACVIALSFFIWKSYDKLSNENKEREKQLYTTLGESQEQMKVMIATNASFVEVIKDMRTSITNVEQDVDNIKDYLELNRRKDDAR